MKKRVETKAFPKRWLELEHECGITQLSLRNLDNIFKKKVKLIAIGMLWDVQAGRYYTKAYFEPYKGRSTVYFHLFTGFSVGGEGNRGFNTLLRLFTGPWGVREIRSDSHIMEKTMILKGYEDHVSKYSVRNVNINNYNRSWEHGWCKGNAIMEG